MLYITNLVTYWARISSLKPAIQKVVWIYQFVSCLCPEVPGRADRAALPPPAGMRRPLARDRLTAPHGLPPPVRGRDGRDGRVYGVK